MKDWIQQHRARAALCAFAVLVAVQLVVALAIGTSWSDALVRILVNAVMGGAFLFLVARHDRRQRAALAGLGIPVHIRRPGSRPGSLEDLWAGGTATCTPGALVFQEFMSGTAVPLGRAKRFDVVASSHEPRNAANGGGNTLPAGLVIQAFALDEGTVEVAADAASLARISAELFAASGSAAAVVQK